MNGKGSKPRPTDIKKYVTNYDEINWHRKPKDSTPRKKEDKKSPS